MNRRLNPILAVLLAVATGAAGAQTTRLERQLSHVDFGLQGVGQFNKAVSGPVTVSAPNQGQVVTESASDTLGGLVTIRYVPKPYLGFEFNGGYARYAESFNVAPLVIQTQANELTFGYIVVPPYTIFGLKPYLSAGAGTIRFAPTAGGGQGAPMQYRAAYYYNLGVQKEIFDHIGVRVGYRQVFFKAPDFIQNYLTINQHTSTSEPLIGLFLRF